MLDNREVMPVPAELFQGSRPHDFNNDAGETLNRRLIISYEQAIQSGLRPLDALSMILLWAAEEISRLHAETSSRPVGR